VFFARPVAHAIHAHPSRDFELEWYNRQNPKRRNARTQATHRAAGSHRTKHALEFSCLRREQKACDATALGAADACATRGAAAYATAPPVISTAAIIVRPVMPQLPCLNSYTSVGRFGSRVLEAISREIEAGLTGRSDVTRGIGAARGIADCMAG
jgi:hypothetical protein